MSGAIRRRQLAQDRPRAGINSAAALDRIPVAGDYVPVLVEDLEQWREARDEAERKDNFGSEVISTVFEPRNARILWATSEHGVEADAEAATASWCAIRG